MDQAHIRNFSIIAHIDHGKSTLADRILELTHTVEPRPCGRRCSTRWISSASAESRSRRRRCASSTRRETARPTSSISSTRPDTSTSTTRCRGRSRRARARCWSSTRRRASRRRRVANTYLAVDAGLELIPRLNKIDLPGAEPERVAGEVAELLGEPAENDPAHQRQDGRGASRRSSRSWWPRSRRRGRPRRAAARADLRLEFDQYRGVVAYIRVVDGDLPPRRRDRARWRTGTQADIDDIGFFTPEMTHRPALGRRGRASSSRASRT